nr:photosynthetic complex putative assembly protein PuhB [Polymorphobacter sp.]
MSEYANEPIRGLPGLLPQGEHIIWQGSPAWRSLARKAMHTHLVGGYFAVLIAWSLLNVATAHKNFAGALPGLEITLGVGVGVVTLLTLLGWLAARATVYTITNKRVVLRFGIALPKCVNLPFSQISAAGLEVHGDGTGDLPLAVKETRLGYLHLWPHVRPWRVGKPEPMLRSLPEPRAVARILGEALAATVPGRRSAFAEPTAAQVFAPAKGSLAA